MKEALSSPEREQWLLAMQEELDALVENGTWEVVDPPPKGTNVVGHKWVLKLKMDSEGAIERFKARLVAQGFSQKYGVDFGETFAPVIKMSSVRLFFVLAAILCLVLRHGDVPNAYLKGMLEELIYMKPPSVLGLEETKVLQLLRPLYGLKQSGRCWNAEIDAFIISIGFKKSKLHEM